MRKYLRIMRKNGLLDALLPKIRQGILAATTLHPGKWWYLSDLARHLGVSPSSLQRELASLVKAGVLLRKESGREVYFRANPDCPILCELQGIMVKTAGLVDVLHEALGPQAAAIRCAFIFGSVARQEELSDSDVDLLIVCEQGLATLAPLLREAENRLGRQVSAAVYSPKEFSAKIKSKDHFLFTVLDGEKIFVIGNQDDLAATSK
ncbi:MAG: nucleotidyltransferase domain-containing protein [Gemmatimonadetes bacterium]|nr:nucleotidyltransferase domain-containing protein [Gemmatimonadota bacterium]